MLRTLCLAVTTLACLELIPLLIAVDKKPLEIEGWGTVIDPDGDCTIKGDNGKISITVPGTAHNLHPTRAMNAPRVLRQIEGDFVVTVKVTCALTPGKKVVGVGATAGNYAGLLLWANESEYIRLERNARWGGDKLISFTPGCEYWKEKKQAYLNTRGPGTTAEFFKTDSTWFRMERKGSSVTAYFSHDGKEWSVCKILATALPVKVLVGVAAINSSDSPFSTEFSEFHVEPRN